MAYVGLELDLNSPLVEELSSADTEDRPTGLGVPAISRNAEVISRLYKNLSTEAATAMSRAERMDNDYTSTTLAYSEVTCDSFIQVI